eukprot:jgi/Psemu1/13108/gm1.13108_g
MIAIKLMVCKVKTKQHHYDGASIAANSSPKTVTETRVSQRHSDGKQTNSLQVETKKVSKDAKNNPEKVAKVRITDSNAI